MDLPLLSIGLLEDFPFHKVSGGFSLFDYGVPMGVGDSLPEYGALDSLSFSEHRAPGRLPFPEHRSSGGFSLFDYRIPRGLSFPRSTGLFGDIPLLYR